MLLSTYGLRTFALTTPVFIIQDPDASHRPTGSTALRMTRGGDRASLSEEGYEKIIQKNKGKPFGFPLRVFGLFQQLFAEGLPHLTPGIGFRVAVVILDRQGENIIVLKENNFHFNHFVFHDSLSFL